MRPPWAPRGTPANPGEETDPQSAVPPWERYPQPERHEGPDEPGYQFGDRLKKMRERLGPPSGLKLLYYKVTPDRGTLPSMKKLKAARKKAQEAGAVVRDEAFDHWLDKSVVTAERPDEWTQARPLYESYLRQAKNYGLSRGDKRLAKQELATETQWGKMMGSVYPNKKRRRNGWYYPVRLKRGA